MPLQQPSARANAAKLSPCSHVVLQTGYADCHYDGSPETRSPEECSPYSCSSPISLAIPHSRTPGQFINNHDQHVTPPESPAQKHPHDILLDMIPLSLEHNDPHDQTVAAHQNGGMMRAASSEFPRPSRRRIGIEATQTDDLTAELGLKQRGALVDLHRTKPCEQIHREATTQQHDFISRHYQCIRSQRRQRSSTAPLYDLIVDGVLNGQKVAAFPDRGAGANFVSQSYFETHELQIDCSKRVEVQVASGKKIHSFGTVKLPFSFKDDQEKHFLNFHVLPRCVSDVVLGSPFLKVTKAFTRFSNCIRRTVRNVLANRVCCLGASQDRIGGWLDGKFVGALPDTGSDVMLMSRSYAEARGFDIDNSAYQLMLEFGDYSTTYTTGVVRGIEWVFGDLDGNDFGATQHCEFYIVDDLVCDVIFSDDFLLRTQAVKEFAHCEFELPVDELCLNAIKAIKIRPSRQQARSTAMTQWNKDLQDEIMFQNDVQDSIRHLSPTERERLHQDLKTRWQALQARRPDVTGQSAIHAQHPGIGHQQSGLRKQPSLGSATSFPAILSATKRPRFGDWSRWKSALVGKLMTVTVVSPALLPMDFRVTLFVKSVMG